jgi:hypothetical protein
MSKSRLIITILAFFMLLGTTSLSMGVETNKIMNMPIATQVAPDGVFEATVNNVVSTYTDTITGDKSSMADLTTVVNGQTQNLGFVQIMAGKEEANIYATLNTAYLGHKSVVVGIQKNRIINVRYL